MTQAVDGSGAATRRTQRERAAESAKRLLIATAELTVEQGFEKTTAGEIGVRAGYSRGMVRERYGSKEALYEALFHEELEPLLARTQTEHDSGLDRVLGQIDALDLLAREDRTMMQAFFVLTFETPTMAMEGARQKYQDYFGFYGARVREALEDGEADGSVRAGLDTDQEAKLFVAKVLTLGFQWSLDRDGFDYVAELRAWRAWLVDRYRPA